jgi:hypothetical protein
VPDGRNPQSSDKHDRGEEGEMSEEIGIGTTLYEYRRHKRDGMSDTFIKAGASHGHYESLFASAAWLLRRRSALAGEAK